MSCNAAVVPNGAFVCNHSIVTNIAVRVNPAASVLSEIGLTFNPASNCANRYIWADISLCHNLPKQSKTASAMVVLHLLDTGSTRKAKLIIHGYLLLLFLGNKPFLLQKYKNHPSNSNFSSELRLLLSIAAINSASRAAFRSLRRIKALPRASKMLI
jgi:hypothetical protein